MAGMLTKGIILSYSSTSSGTKTALTNMQTIPDIGGTRDSVEVTVLTDDMHTYISGLKSAGDSIDFTFIYEPTQFATLDALTGIQYWELGIPDGTDGAIGSKCTWSGDCSVKLDGKTYNEAMTYTLSIKPNSTMVWA